MGERSEWVDSAMIDANQRIVEVHWKEDPYRLSVRRDRLVNGKWIPGIVQVYWIESREMVEADAKHTEYFNETIAQYFI